MVTEVRELDTLTVTPEENGIGYDNESELPEEIFDLTPDTLPVYRPTSTRTHDLLHTKLELSFDWEREMVIGKATLTLEPLLYPSRSLTLDAKNFDFNSITLSGQPLTYTYEGDKQTIDIDLGREYAKEEEYTIVLDYTAIPAASGGSAAITSDKGLFFINPRGEETGKPRQIWTQGETENNSRWFPTIDKPNERCTQEIYVTVAEKYKTLSNGTLVSSEPADDGKRTDYWKMDQPHAPYLFALIVGEFDVVDDQPWNGIPVNYYMEDGWAEHAKAIYPYTREMLTFFSELTGVQYPWPKYSQVAVRDYVSGAMENTTAVIFGEFMHGTDRDLIDVDRNEKIVAHEMFHHWFGDLVTCESWSNLTLNEGFANYSEYLWMQQKHGQDAADYHLLQEWQGYLRSVSSGEPHELIWYDYADKEDMFDAHSYNKGGAVLHMLRHYLGDEAFFTSFTNYLQANEYSPVEVDELRIAFEETSGQDLNWFFDQWFLKAGHPQLTITKAYGDGVLSMTVAQTQSTENNVPAIFKIPVNIDIYTNGTARRERVWLTQREQTLSFDVATEPDVVIFDPEHQLLAEYDYQKSPSEIVAQYRYAPAFLDRYSALARLSVLGDEQADLKEELFTNALTDDFYVIRGVALQSLEEPTEAQLEIIRRIAREDEHSQVRATAITILAERGDEATTGVAEAALDARAYTVVAAGLEALVATDLEAANQSASRLEAIDNDDISGALAALYSESGNLEKLGYFEDRLNQSDGYGAIDLYTAYQALLAKGSAAQQTTGVARLKDIALDQEESPWRRLAATKAISDLRTALAAKVEEMTDAADLNKLIMEMGTSLETIKAAETDADLKQIYQQF